MLTVIIVGQNRTMMTIECIKHIKQHLKCQKFQFVIGSDRSEDGHIQAIHYYLNTLNVPYTVLECTSLGNMLNTCCNEAFKHSNNVLCIENDMILHNDLHVDKYIKLMSNTNVGNICFRYFSPETHKCSIRLFEYDDSIYALTIPGSDLSSTCPVQFGQNLFNKQFYEAIGGFLENEYRTDVVERDFVHKYCQQLRSQCARINAVDIANMHKSMNDERGYFYHVGVFSQHANVTWNKNIIPSQYHYLSDASLDSSFRNMFIGEKTHEQH